MGKSAVDYRGHTRAISTINSASRVAGVRFGVWASSGSNIAARTSVWRTA